MENKITGERIRRLREKQNLSQSELAEMLGYKTYTTISKWESNDSLPRGNELKKISQVLGASSDYILGLSDDIATNISYIRRELEGLISIPVLGSIACGEPITAEENIDEYRETLKSSVPAGNLFYLKAKGDSMYPKIPDGSYVMVREQSDVENGEIAAVLLNSDEEATLKRVRKLGDSILLESINEDYAPYLVNEDNPARIVGKAVKLEVDL
ncbi:LexA family protein [Dolosicoccus paucivorans]